MKRATYIFLRNLVLNHSPVTVYFILLSTFYLHDIYTLVSETENFSRPQCPQGTQQPTYQIYICRVLHVPNRNHWSINSPYLAFDHKVEKKNWTDNYLCVLQLVLLPFNGLANINCNTKETKKKL